MDQMFQELRVGPNTFQNRIVMAPMTRARAGKERIPNDKMMEYYALRATAGLIISEGAQISNQAIGWEQTPGIHTLAQIQGWKRITNAVHNQGGKIFCQLWHCGRASHSSLKPDRSRPVSSSPVAIEGSIRCSQGELEPQKPLELRPQEIKAIVGDYRQAASNAKAAGFDGVEIHAANGYLIDQFLRDGVNQRTDDYGGSFENRFRFLKEIIEAVSEVIDSQRIGVRVSPTSSFNDMEDSDPAGLFTYVARELSKFELAYLHVVEPKPKSGHFMAEEGAEFVTPKIRESYSGLLMLNGGYDYDTAERSLQDGLGDWVSFGVPFIANPDLVARFVQEAPLNEADQNTFYTHGEKGYIDYPLLGVQRAVG